MTDQRERVRLLYATLAASTQACEPSGSTPYRGIDIENVPGSAVAASLGCGNPHSLVDLRPGDRVLDLGSGAGLDVLVSARRVGPTGRAYGLDMTPEMLTKARQNAAEAGIDNVEFLQGLIEEIPLPDDSVDVVLSNCVIVLSADKQKVFQESARVLRPGGRLAIADLIAPQTWQASDTSCCVGSEIPITAAEYERQLEAAGFTAVSITSDPAAADGLVPSHVRAQLPLRAIGAFKVRSMTSDDWPSVERIYQAGIATGNATFETASPGWPAWDAAHLPDLRLVAVDRNDHPLGWAAASSVSDRCVYEGVIENSVYVNPSAWGQGLGKLLLKSFVDESERLGYWTIQSGIFPENVASLVLHEASGFRVVGRREKVGRHRGAWRDVLMVERRSSTVGQF